VPKFSIFERRNTTISDSDRFVYVIALLLVFIMAARTPLDGDMWWHLRAGQETLQQRAPLLVDTFSYTRTGQPWINHSWLAQVGMAALFQRAGFPGLSSTVAMLAVGSLCFVLLQLDGPAIMKAFLLIFAGVVAAPVWSPRPQTISLFLIALVGYLVYLYKWRRVNRLWMLPLVMAVWSNLHGGYVLGFLVMGCLLGGETLNHVLGFRGEEVLSWKALARMLGWTAASGAAVLINPNGFNTWLIPFQTVNVDILQNLIAEWASPDFHQLAQQPLLWLTFALLASIGLSGRRLDGTDLLAVCGFGIMAFVSRRNFGPFALAALPVLSRHLWPAWQGWQERITLPMKLHDAIQSRQAKENVNRSPLQRAMNLLVVGFFALIATGKVFGTSHPALMGGYLKQLYPVQAVNWLAGQELSGNLLSEYNWGGYLDWFLPEEAVFVDGRTDLFGDEIIGQWLNMVQGGEGWQADLQRWQVGAVFLQPGRPLVKLLVESGWEVRYRDAQAIILSR
jgi:hypothetical protein